MDRIKKIINDIEEEISNTTNLYSNFYSNVRKSVKDQISMLEEVAEGVYKNIIHIQEINSQWEVAEERFIKEIEKLENKIIELERENNEEN